MKLRIFAVLAVAGLLAGCGGKAAPPAAGQPPDLGLPGTPAAAAPTGPRLTVSDACALLTKDEVAAVVGGKVRIGFRAPNSCVWEGPDDVTLHLEIIENMQTPQRAIGDERDLEQRDGNPVQVVSGIGDAAVFVARERNVAGYLLMVGRANLLFLFTSLDSLPDQDGKTELVPAWRKLLALAVSRTG